MYFLRKLLNFLCDCWHFETIFFLLLIYLAKQLSFLFGKWMLNCLFILFISWWNSKNCRLFLLFNNLLACSNTTTTMPWNILLYSMHFFLKKRNRHSNLLFQLFLIILMLIKLYAIKFIYFHLFSLLLIRNNLALYIDVNYFWRW